MQNPTIRRAVSADAPAITRLVHDAYAPYIARLGTRPGPMLDDYAALVAANTVWVLEVAGTIAGVLVLHPAPDHLLIDNVAVAPSHAGHGLGRQLLVFAEGEGRRLGLAELRLYTHVLMHENIAMYGRAGWTETGRGEQAGFHRVFMRKPVAP